MNIYEKLLKIQSELKCPKNQYNSFGKYSYRSAEDILESVKPFFEPYKCLITCDDEIIFVNERYYIRATAKFYDAESCETLYVHAVAREEETKKGMDGSQITGTSSSYARKYVLNGLLAIDDNKDSDIINKDDNTEYITEEQMAKFKDLDIEEKSAIVYCKVDSLKKITKSQAQAMIEAKEKAIKKLNA